MGREQQLELKMQKNREAQEESLRRREELIQELELKREIRRHEKEQEEGRRTAWIQELNAQVGICLLCLITENLRKPILSCHNSSLLTCI